MTVFFIPLMISPSRFCGKPTLSFHKSATTPPPLSPSLVHTSHDIAWQRMHTSMQRIESSSHCPDERENLPPPQSLARYVKNVLDIEVDPNTMFDIQVKRIHEYKRQLLNVLQIIHRYNTLKGMSPDQRKNVVKKTCFIGGKVRDIC